MKEVYRTDRGALRSPTVTPQGFYRVDAHVARAGIYEYRNDDGSTRYELRPHSEVMDPEALASYDAAPVTIEHPPENEITSDNVRKYEVGTVSGRATPDDDHVRADVVIKDAKAIKLAKAGKQELSPGYKIHLYEGAGADARYAYPGNPTGRYDAIQRHIRVNHLAMTDRARGGGTVRMRLDSADIVRHDGEGKLTSITAGHQHLIDMTDWNGSRQSSGCTSSSMSEGADRAHDHPWVLSLDGKLTIGEADGHSHTMLPDAPPAVGASSYVDPSLVAESRGDQFDHHAARHDAGGTMNLEDQIRSLKEQLKDAEAKLPPLVTSVAKEQARADTAEGQLTTTRAENTELRAKIAAAATEVESAAVNRERIRADAAEGALRTRNDEFDGLVLDRAQLERKVQVVMGPEFNPARVSKRELLATVVRRLDAQQDTSSKVSDVYLEARFDSLLDLHNRNARSLQRISEIVTRQDADRIGETREDSLEEKRRKRDRMGSEPLPNSRDAARNQGRA